MFQTKLQRIPKYTYLISNILTKIVPFVR